MFSVKISTGNKNIRAILVLPASKSISSRLLIIKSLCKDDFKIENLSDSNDTKILADCLKNCNSREVFDVGDAGTPFRFLTALFAVTPGARILTGNERLCERPIKPLVDTLRRMGAQIDFLGEEGFPPLSIKGKEIQGGKVLIDAAISSQFVSALLLIAPVLPNGLEIELKKDVASAPYISLTLGMMKYFGIDSEWNDDFIKIKPQKYQAINYSVEADWSAAAFWFETAAIDNDAEIELCGLLEKSLQGDAFVEDVFTKLGIESAFLQNSVMLKNGTKNTSFFELDFVDIPDMFPAVVAACAALKIPFRFTGLRNLALKESNRVEAMVSELSKFGFRFRFEEPDVLFSNGFEHGSGNEIVCNSHNDHRIVMALAPLSLLGYNIIIQNPLCVSKSYPSFFDNLKSAGFNVCFSEIL